MSEGTVEAALDGTIRTALTVLVESRGAAGLSADVADAAFEALAELAALRSRGSSDSLASDGGNEVEFHAHRAAYELVTARSDLRAAKRRISQLEGERGSSDTEWSAEGEASWEQFFREKGWLNPDDPDFAGSSDTRLTEATDITTPLGRARWILTTDERGTQAEVDTFDGLADALREILNVTGEGAVWNIADAALAAARADAPQEQT